MMSKTSMLMLGVLATVIFQYLANTVQKSLIYPAVTSTSIPIQNLRVSGDFPNNENSQFQALAENSGAFHTRPVENSPTFHTDPVLVEVTEQGLNSSASKYSQPLAPTSPKNSPFRMGSGNPEAAVDNCPKFFSIIDSKRNLPQHGNTLPAPDLLKVQPGANLMTAFDVHKLLFEQYFDTTKSEQELDIIKKQLNDLSLSLNCEQFSPFPGHLPVWIRVMERLDPTVAVFDALARVDNLSTSVLFITIDGKRGTRPILEAIMKIKFTCVRIFFHSYTTDPHVPLLTGGSLNEIDLR